MVPNIKFGIEESNTIQFHVSKLSRVNKLDVHALLFCMNWRPKLNTTRLHSILWFYGLPQIHDFYIYKRDFYVTI